MPFRHRKLSRSKRDGGSLSHTFQAAAAAVHHTVHPGRRRRLKIDPTLGLLTIPRRPSPGKSPDNDGACVGADLVDQQVRTGAVGLHRDVGGSVVCERRSLGSACVGEDVVDFNILSRRKCLVEGPPCCIDREDVVRGSVQDERRDIDLGNVSPESVVQVGTAALEAYQEAPAPVSKAAGFRKQELHRTTVLCGAASLADFGAMAVGTVRAAMTNVKAVARPRIVHA